MKKALITGIGGQDGSYLAEFLLEKNYEVHGFVRKLDASYIDEGIRFRRLESIKNQILLHYGDLTSYSSVLRTFEEIQPNECYHLAAQSSVYSSFSTPFSTMSVNIDGTHHILAAIQSRVPKCRLYFAGSSEMYGNISQEPQDEETPFMPQSPYAISKVAGFYLTQYYRQAYGIFACSGILFNHESPRRGVEFVTQKIIQNAVEIKLGCKNTLILGNLNAKRDWGYAKEYITVMWQMLQQEKPEDFVIGTGKNYTILDFVDLVFEELSLTYELVDLHKLSIEDADRELNALSQNDGNIYLIQHPRFFRPLDVKNVRANPQKAKKQLEWEPQVGIEALIKIMIKEAMKKAQD